MEPARRRARCPGSARSRNPSPGRGPSADEPEADRRERVIEREREADPRAPREREARRVHGRELVEGITREGATAIHARLSTNTASPSRITAGRGSNRGPRRWRAARHPSALRALPSRQQVAAGPSGSPHARTAVNPPAIPYRSILRSRTSGRTPESRRAASSHGRRPGERQEPPTAWRAPRRSPVPRRCRGPAGRERPCRSRRGRRLRASTDRRADRR